MVHFTNQEMSFKLNTGAEVTAISEGTFNKLENVTLQAPSKILFGPTRKSLKVLGQFNGTFQMGQKESLQTVFVVRGLKANLLGLPAIKSLQVLKRLDTVPSAELSIQQRFPKVFWGLGTLGDPYVIKLKADAKPYVLYTPRNIPIPLRDKVREELVHMEAMGVISKVTQPSQWCAGMVVVPKSSGAVRICVDLKPLNARISSH